MNILITAGATIEKIDPVRYISNFSSGKQGIKIAEAFIEKNYNVTLIIANNNLNIDISKKINIIKVSSAKEMMDQVLINLPSDIAIFTAAVCDWRPIYISEVKLKKHSDQKYMNLNLIKNPDILKIVSNHDMRPKIVIGFAAETDDILVNARKKLIDKNCDMIIANLITEENNVFASDENEIYIISKEIEEYYSRRSKSDIAKIIVRKAKELITD